MLSKDELNDIFKNQEFTDLETAEKNKEIFLKEILNAVRENKVNEIDILTRVITKVSIDEKNNRDTKYSVEFSLHKPGSIDKLTMFDACLTTYFLNELDAQEPIVRYITGSSAEGKFLKTIPEHHMVEHCHKLISRGEKLNAQKIEDTWNLAREKDKFEEYIG